MINSLTEKTRNELIDVLRGVAIILVLILHFHLSYPLEFGNIINLEFLRNGNYGVTMFFVISGYLISSNAFKRYENLSSINMRHFYFLRCARILPPLLLALSIIIFLSIFDVKPLRIQYIGKVWIRHRLA